MTSGHFVLDLHRSLFPEHGLSAVLFLPRLVSQSVGAFGKGALADRVSSPRDACVLTRDGAFSQRKLFYLRYFRLKQDGGDLEWVRFFPIL